MDNSFSGEETRKRKNKERHKLVNHASERARLLAGDNFCVSSRVSLTFSLSLYYPQAKKNMGILAKLLTVFLPSRPHFIFFFSLCYAEAADNV